MTNSFLSFNILSSVADNNRYKRCAINNCENDGVYFLSCSVIYKIGLFCKYCSVIYKIGLFCKYCSVELEECGLVDSGEHNNFTKESVV